MYFKNLPSRLFFVLIIALISENGYCQEEKTEKFNTGADIFSSYIWRGTKYGIGPVVQPFLKFTSGSFTAGGWGCFDFMGYQEADLNFLISLTSGFSFGMTDYYFPNLDYFDLSKNSGSHAFEINTGFSKGGFSVSANYILNKAGGAGSSGNDVYLQAGFSFGSFIFFAGAGNGWFSRDNPDGSDRFNVCMIGLGTSKTINVTDTFKIPVTGQIICNPDRRKMYVVIGFSL